MKYCKRCKEEKPLDCFGNLKSAKDGKQYYCKPCTNAANATSYNKHKEKRLKQVMAYRETEAGIEAYNKSQANYRSSENGKLVHKEICSRYRKSDKGKETKRNCEGRRRARIQENGVESFTYEDLRMFWLGQNILDDRCYYCRKSFSGKPEHIDHYIPIAKGGSHTKVNLRPSCAKCNLKKNDKHPIQFMKEINNG